MDILYVGMKYDYGEPKRGYSFEHFNLLDTLHHMGHNILYFDFPTLLAKYGKKSMNERLCHIAASEKPDLLFTVLFKDEFSFKTFKDISLSGNTITINWFCDDHWRFDNYSRYWAPCFNWVVTTSKNALLKYDKIGYKNVIKSQWACNPWINKRIPSPLVYDVTFVGQPHARRRDVVDYLRKAGINIQVWGIGWETGRVSQEQMVHIFNQSRINLNFANASVGKLSFLDRAAIRIKNDYPISIKPLNYVIDKLQPLNPNLYDFKNTQIKGRNFEVPGCGGFLLTDRSENLEDYYQFGLDIACFDNLSDLTEKIRYYLSHEDERLAIAESGYVRTRQQHTYVHRFNDVFGKIGLKGIANYGTDFLLAKPGNIEEAL